VTPRRLRSPALLAAGTLVATFAAGAATGAAVERARAPDPAQEAPLRVRGTPPIYGAAGPLAEQLELTVAQRDSIEAILTAERARADSLYREFRPRLRARMDSSTAAVEAVLTPEQRTEWMRMRREHHRRGMGMRRHGPGGGPDTAGPDPPP
jgi:Spy/CpxP family protein refolding chaperone